MAIFNMKITGIEQMLRGLEQMGKLNIQKTAHIANLMHNSVMQNFQNEGNYENSQNFIGGTKKWKPLASKTIIRRVRLGYGARPILKNTGALKRGITKAYNGKTAGLRVDTGAIRYAMTHQYGRGRIPARPYLNISRSTYLAIEQFILRSMRW